MRTVDFDDIVALGQSRTNVIVESKNLRKAMKEAEDAKFKLDKVLSMTSDDDCDGECDD